MQEFAKFFLFWSMVLGGMLLESAVQKLHFKLIKTHYKEHHLTMGKYLFFLLFPMTAFIILLKTEGWTVGQVFITFAILGTLAEWIMGYTYHQIVGQRLWTYHKYSLSHYTSWLSVPLWGLAGVMFFLLARLFT